MNFKEKKYLISLIVISLLVVFPFCLALECERVQNINVIFLDNSAGIEGSGCLGFDNSDKALVITFKSYNTTNIDSEWYQKKRCGNTIVRLTNDFVSIENGEIDLSRDGFGILVSIQGASLDKARLERLQ